MASRTPQPPRLGNPQLPSPPNPAGSGRPSTGGEDWRPLTGRRSGNHLGAHPGRDNLTPTPPPATPRHPARRSTSLPATSSGWLSPTWGHTHLWPRLLGSRWHTAAAPTAHTAALAAPCSPSARSAARLEPPQSPPPRFSLPLPGRGALEARAGADGKGSPAHGRR